MAFRDKRPSSIYYLPYILFIMNTKKVKLSEIKPSENNPRIIRDHKFKALVKSIREFPQMLELRPIVVDASGTILGGNMRYNACKEAGLKEIPVLYATELTEAQMQEFVIKDNVNFGEWNWDTLANEWDQDLLVNWGIDSFNFGTEAELIVFDGDLNNEDNPNYQRGEESTPEAPKITDTGYVRFELVMLEVQKVQLVDTLNEIKDRLSCSLGEALFELHRHYQTTK